MSLFDQQYQSLVKTILEEGSIYDDGRTGKRMQGVPGMVFSCYPERDGFPLLTLRKIPVKLFTAEMVWFLTGARDPDFFLSSFTKIWHDFLEDDGLIRAAYGYRWRHHFGRDQLEGSIQLLERDPTSRHAVIVYWDPADDGLADGTKKKNVPCPYTFTLNILDGKLNMHLTIRSNDMMLGFPHDVAGHVLLQYILAQRLGVGVGKYTHAISHAHIYLEHEEQARDIISRPTDHAPITFAAPPDAYRRAFRADTDLVVDMVNQLSQHYIPQPPVKKMQIAL